MTISSWLSLLYYSEHLYILTFSKQSIIHKNKDRNIKSSLSMRFVNLLTFNYFSTIFKAESANINILQIQHQTKSTLFQLSWIFSFPLLNTIIKRLIKRTLLSSSILLFLCYKHENDTVRLFVPSCTPSKCKIKNRSPTRCSLRNIQVLSSNGSIVCSTLIYFCSASLLPPFFHKIISFAPL